LGGSVHTIKKNTEAVVVASNETGLEVNADKTNYMLMTQDQDAEQNHMIQTDNCSFERMEELKYLGITLTNKNYILEEIKSRLMSGNACYHLVQNLLSSSLLTKNYKVKVYRTIIFLLLDMGVKLGSSH
jgi:hypothetical protein